jgi:glycosyltransferase involved in cell wall biosynthesis
MVRIAGRGEVKVTVVMPAYNAAKTLRQTYQRILGQPVDEIMVSRISRRF